MDWKWLALTVLATIVVGGESVHDPMMMDDMHIVDFECRGVNASYRRMKDWMGQTVSDICPEGRQVVVRNRGNLTQMEDVVVKLHYSEFCMLGEPFQSMVFSGQEVVSGLPAGSDRTIDISSWALQTEPYCGLGCLVASIQKASNASAGHQPTKYSALPVMRKCNTTGVDLAIKGAISPEMDYTNKFIVRPGMTVKDMYDAVQTPTGELANFSLTIENIGTSDLPRFSAATPVTVSVYLTKDVTSFLGRCKDPAVNQHVGGLPYPDIKVTDTVYDGGVKVLKKMLYANAANKWVLTKEDYADVKVNFGQPGYCALCGDVYSVTILDALQYVDDPNRCNNYYVGRIKVDCSQGAFNDPMVRENVLLIPDVGGRNGHEAIVKHCKEGKVAVYRTNVTIAGEQGVGWQRVEHESPTMMGWGLGLLWNEYAQKLAGPDGRHAPEICKRVDEFDRHNENKEYDVPHVGNHTISKRSAASDEEAKALGTVMALMGMLDWNDPQTALATLRAMIEPHYRQNKESGLHMERLLRVARGMFSKINQTDTARYMEIGDPASGKCPIYAKSTLGWYRKFYQDYILLTVAPGFTDTLYKGADENCVWRSLGILMRGGMWEVGFTDLKELMRREIPMTQQLAEMRAWVTMMSGADLVNRCPPFDMFKGDTIFPIFWAEEGGKIFMGVRGFLTGQVLWKMVGVLHCPNCQPGGSGGYSGSGYSGSGYSGSGYSGSGYSGSGYSGSGYSGSGYSGSGYTGSGYTGSGYSGSGYTTPSY